ncbi:MAG TPA: tRNA lysidine(34) synthetase TilS [Thermoanaerobaculia bacterium]|nr:tRNA lysidine(34) synthetase TilS [Thermoanaerobaculia bacterium]
MNRMDPVVSALRRAADGGLIPRGSSVLLAVSGGADSMALLYGAFEVAAETGWRLAIGHVHHGWRAREADRDLAFVAGHGRRLGLPSYALRRDAAAVARELGLSPEAGARQIRYAALAEMAREAGASLIATAHQSDDAVESLVIARERRGGIASLAGPREARADGVVRPLLGVSREEILRFLSGRGISYRRDATNGDLTLSRNRVRRRLAELSRAPGGADAIRALGAEVARLGAERLELEARYEAEIRPSVTIRADGVSIDAPRLAGLPEELQRLALTRMAAPFARPGKPPTTGRERERLLALLASGEDFRFEAGRHIRFERRGGRLSIGPRPGGPVYDARRRPSVNGQRREVPE